LIIIRWDSNKLEPKELNKTIKQYSVIGVYAPIKFNLVPFKLWFIAVVRVREAVVSPVNKALKFKNFIIIEGSY